MDSDGKFFVTMTIVILSGLVTLAAVIAGCDTIQTKYYTEHGYTRVQKTGTTESMWVLPGKDSGK